ncbi:hypothetical protein HK102_003708, partial [Quaeritorhiza haematococci]
MPEQQMLAARADPDALMVDVMDGHPLGMMNGRKEKRREDDDSTVTSGVLVNVCRLETGLIAAQSKSVDGSNVAMRKKKEMKRTMENIGNASNATLFPEDHVVTVACLRILSDQGESPVAKERLGESDKIENPPKSPKPTYADVVAGRSLFALPMIRKGVGIGSDRAKDLVGVKDVVNGGGRGDGGRAGLIEVNLVDEEMDVVDAVGGDCVDIGAVGKGKEVEVENGRRKKELQDDRENRFFKAKIMKVLDGVGFPRAQEVEKIVVNFAHQPPTSNSSSPATSNDPSPTPTTTDRLRALAERIERWADQPVSIPRYQRVAGRQATGMTTVTQIQTRTTSQPARTRSQARAGGDVSGSLLASGSGAGDDDDDDDEDDADDEGDNDDQGNNVKRNNENKNNENNEGDGDAGYAVVRGEVVEVPGTCDKGKERVERASTDSDDAFMEQVAKCIRRYERAKKASKGETTHLSGSGVGTSALFQRRSVYSSDGEDEDVGLPRYCSRGAREVRSTRGRNDGSNDGEAVAMRNRGCTAGRRAGDGGGGSDDNGSSDDERRSYGNDNDGARRRRDGGDGSSGDDSGDDDGRGGAGGARPRGQRRLVDRGEQRGPDRDPGLGHIIERLLANNERLLTSNEVLARQQLMQQNPPKPWGEKENIFEWLDYLLVWGRSVNFDVTTTASRDGMIRAAIKLMPTNKDFPPGFLKFLNGSWVDIRRPIVSVIEEGVTNKLEFNDRTAIEDILADVVGKIGQHADIRGMKFLLAILQTAVKGATSLHSGLQAIRQSLSRTFASGSLTLRQLQRQGLKRNRIYIDDDSSDLDSDKRAERKDAKKDTKKGNKRRRVVVDTDSSSKEDLRGAVERSESEAALNPITEESAKTADALRSVGEVRMLVIEVVAEIEKMAAKESR